MTEAKGFTDRLIRRSVGVFDCQVIVIPTMI
jgi:hypothetical protein